MDKDIRKGKICALLAAGLHMEGLLRVGLERADDDPVLETEIRDTFKRYSAIFDSIFPEECE
ncbi:MAG: hypothetical protein K2M12_10375, partial [Muribaculaceae bacterium]|nr:hypothetical protein [Muribaculaceae bacterium]